MRECCCRRETIIYRPRSSADTLPRAASERHFINNSGSPREKSMANDRIIYNIIQSPIGELVAGASPAGCCVCEFHDRGGFERIRTRVERRHGMEMAKGHHPLIGMMESQL